MIELIKQFNEKNNNPLGMWLEENINHIDDLEKASLIDEEEAMKMFLTNLKIQGILD